MRRGVMILFLLTSCAKNQLTGLRAPPPVVRCAATQSEAVLGLGAPYDLDSWGGRVGDVAMYVPDGWDDQHFVVCPVMSIGLDPTKCRVQLIGGTVTGNVWCTTRSPDEGGGPGPTEMAWVQP